MRLLINQADNNVNKTVQTSNSNIDNFQRNRTKIKNPKTKVTSDLVIEGLQNFF